MSWVSIRDPGLESNQQLAGDWKQIQVDGEEKWPFTTADTEPQLLLELDFFSLPQNAARSGGRTRSRGGVPASSLRESQFRHIEFCRC